MKLSVAVALSLIFLLAPFGLRGANDVHVPQTFRSGIAGRITDPNGAVVAGASIRITPRSSDNALLRRSDDQGEYVADLDPGNYDVEVDAAGFKKTKRKSIPVMREARSFVDFVLAPKERFDSSPVIGGAQPNNSGMKDEVKHRFLHTGRSE